MAFKVAQNLSALFVSASGGITTSNPIALQTGNLRITSTSASYIAIGSTQPGISTDTSLYLPANDPTVVKSPIASQRVVGITTGSTTIVSFPEGTGSPFTVGDYVELTGISPAGINTNYARVSSSNGGINPNVTITFNTSAQGPVTDPEGNLRKVIKIAAQDAYSGGTNKIHITEVQITSQA
jgi:hypothetical protein